LVQDLRNEEAKGQIKVHEPRIIGGNSSQETVVAHRALIPRAPVHAPNQSSMSSKLKVYSSLR
jgi:hypothetical protein